MAQVARGVGAAHSRGIVHRDLKPANILLTADGVPKVADFGLAKQLGADSRTVSGALVGTPAYMSPEQAAGQVHRITPRTDVFSLGVILYELLTGRPPFTADGLGELLAQHMYERPRPPRELVPRFPARLEETVLQLLAKEPAARPSSPCRAAARSAVPGWGWPALRFWPQPCGRFSPRTSPSDLIFAPPIGSDDRARQCRIVKNSYSAPIMG